MASFKHLDNGNVQITITHGKRFDGTPNRFYRTVKFTSQKQLEVDAALFLADVINGDATLANSATVKAVFNDFLKCRTELGQTTLSRYKLLFDHQIGPYLGARKLNTITRSDVRGWVATIKEKGNKRTGGPLAPKTVKNALSLLSTIFNHAIYDLEIVEKNPCTRIKIPDTAKASTVTEFYTEDEVAELLRLLSEKLNDPRSCTHATLLFLILFTGMRTGEVMGLKWKNVDFDKKQITIEAERLYTSESGVVDGTTKTESSKRTISVPDFVMDMLAKLKRHQDFVMEVEGSNFTYTDYVAITATGEPQHPRNMYKWFKKFQKANGLKDATVHDLRHTHAAMLSRMGVKIIDISKRLGHSNTRITQEVYEYLFKDMDDDISKGLNDYYKKTLN